MKARSTFPARKLAGSIVAALAFVCQGSNASDAYSANYPTGGMDVRINSQLSERLGAMALTGRFQTGVPRYLRGGRASSRQVAAEVTARRPAATVQVTNCDDSGSGSLRDTIASAVSGDTLDLSQLTCSTITLASEGFSVPQDDLTIVGPGASSLVIDGAGAFSQFTHYGNGTLSLDGITIANGYYDGNGMTYSAGGCIFSTSNVLLQHAVVSGCIASGVEAIGGGIATLGDLTVIDSVITQNQSLGYGLAGSAGFKVNGDLTLLYSTVSDNSARSSHYHSIAGAFHATANALIQNSTISGNYSDAFPGFMFSPYNNAPLATIVNSTISGNQASARGLFGGGYTSVPLSIYNSTIAFNAGLQVGGVYANNAALTLQSTIIADNNGTDVHLAGTATVDGANNLIHDADSVPPGTIRGCPQLERLAGNGGVTLTDMLRSTSPAIDMGNNQTAASFDQRGSGYARTFGASPDIGAVEWGGHADERIFNSGFEGGCDE